MLLSGTLADLDLASIAAVTGLGRSSLRLELRASSGELVGSLVLKAGRVVSASAGGSHGHAALRVIMSSSSDTRFQLAHEALDFALASALASVDDLGNLLRGATASRPRLPTAEIPQAGTRARTTSQTVGRVQMMQGLLGEFDLLTLLQTIGVGRQLVEIDVRDRAGTSLGVIAVKSGKIVYARAGETPGVEAIWKLLSSTRSFQFAAFRVAGRLGQAPELASVSEVSVRFAHGTAELRPDRVVMEGGLSDFDIPTLLQTVGCSRQYCAIEVHNEATPAGTIFVKSGIVLSATAGQLAGIEALQYLMSLHEHEQFRLVHLVSEIPKQVPLGPISHVLLELTPPELAAQPSPAPAQPSPAAAQPSPAPVGPLSGSVPIQVDHVVPPVNPDLVMEGSFSDFDLRTLLEVLTATRQYARLQILDHNQVQVGDISVKAGWIISSQAGALQGRPALIFLLGLSKQLRFRVLTVLQGPGSNEPLGSVHELFSNINDTNVDRTGRAEPTTRSLRWAIPVSSIVGGAIVFFVLRGGTAMRSVESHRTPIATMKVEPALEVRVPPGPAAVSPPAQPTAAVSPPAQPTETSSPSVQPRAVASSLPSAEPAPPRVGIKSAQSALQRLGFDPGPIDNVYGRLTREAIIRFQRSQHLKVTGVLDQETWSAIVAQLTN